MHGGAGEGLSASERGARLEREDMEFLKVDGFSDDEEEVKQTQAASSDQTAAKKERS